MLIIGLEEKLCVYYILIDVKGIIMLVGIIIDVVIIVVYWYVCI